MPAAARTRFTPQKREAFLDALERTGAVLYACREVGISRRTAYDHRQADEAFAIAWADAEERVTEKLEREAMRRAADGTTKPVFHRGEEVGQIREYSDTLLIFLLKARNPAKYRENVKVEHSGTIRQEIEIPVDAAERSRRAVELLAEVQALQHGDDA